MAKKEKIDAVALERAAIEAGVSEEWLGMWRRGGLSNEALATLTYGSKAIQAAIDLSHVRSK